MTRLEIRLLGFPSVRLDAGRFLAAGIPGARLVELPGNDHWFWAGDRQPLIASIAELAARRC
jgi:hypothetical protein